MEFKLLVIEGPQAGTEYRYSGNEADNILVGRDDVESEAKIRLSAEDRYISRSQFLLEFRPPNLLLRDPGSVNGTLLSRGGEPWRPVEEELLQDGDLIRIGYTNLRFEWVDQPVILREPELEAQPPVPPAPDETPKSIHADNERYCIRCDRRLDHTLVLNPLEIRDLDFMCQECQKEISVERRSLARQPARQPVACTQCGADISQLAYADGRVEDLLGVVTYLCPACAEKLSPKGRQAIGEYWILKELGRGGMGVVYRAWHSTSGRVVALKQILPAVKMEPLQLQRFQREMSILQDLKHSHLTRLIASGSESGAPYFVLELVSGGNLDQFISPHGQPLLSPLQTCQVIADALLGLDYLHQHGYVHRDIKPENILFQRQDGSLLPKLVDFGLARSFEQHGGTLSRTGDCAGTLMYMPPEQITQFKRCQPPVDLYAMGVTLYYLLTGYYSLDFPSLREIQQRGAKFRLKKDPVRMILDDPPTLIHERRPDLPSAICTVVDRAVKKKAADRYPSAMSFRQALLSVPGVGDRQVNIS